MRRWLDESDSDGEFATSPLFGEVYAELAGAAEEGGGEVGVEELADVEAGKVDGQVLWTVLDVYDGREKVVRLWRGVGCAEHEVRMRGKWVTSKISPGDQVFVVAEWKGERSVVVDNEAGFVVLFPHLSVAASRMSLCVKCMRNAYLSYLLPAGVANTDLIYGTVAHEVVQKVLDGCAVEDLVQVMDAVAESQVGSVTAAGALQKEFRERLEQIVPLAQEIRDRMTVETVPKLEFDVTSLPPYGCKVVAEEEVLHSFQYGLTGRVDVTLSDGKLFPLEMKSGGCGNAQGYLPHVAQLNSYILMMKEKYNDLAHDFGVLYYMKTNSSIKVEPPQSQIQSLILMRNNLVHAHLHGEIPETVAVPTFCKDCETLNPCAFLGKFDIEGNHIHDFLEKNVPLKMKRHRYEFYKALDDKLLGDLMKQKVEQGSIWTGRPELRIARGNAIGSLQLTINENGEFEFQSERFSRSNFRLYSVFLLTRAGKLPILGRGTITHLTDDRAEVRFTELRVGINTDNLFIDLFEYPTEVSIARANLMLMFSYVSQRQSENMQRLIIDGDRPVFRTSRYEIDSPDLDQYQRRAIQKGLAVKDYLLIDGMTMTGKTTVLMILITCLVQQRKRILVIGPSSAAVDYFCLKLVGMVQFIRVSLVLSVHPEIVPYTSATLIDRVKNQEEMLDVLAEHLVYVTTLSDYRHEIVMSHPFDILLVDDASQIKIVDIIGPLALCSKFILAGDMTISSHDSLYQRLGRFNPESMCCLQGYYGSNAKLFRMMNHMFYQNTYHQMDTDMYPLVLPKRDLIECFHQLHKSWIGSVISQEGVAICDVTKIPAFSESITAALFVSLVIFGMDPSKIGITTFNRTNVPSSRKTLNAALTEASLYFPKELQDPSTIASLAEIHCITSLRDELGYLMKEIDVGLVLLTEPNIDHRHFIEAVMSPMRATIIVTTKDIIRTNPITTDIQDNSQTIVIPEALCEASVKPFVSLCRLPKS